MDIVYINHILLIMDSELREHLTFLIIIVKILINMINAIAKIVYWIKMVKHGQSLIVDNENQGTCSGNQGRSPFADSNYNNYTNGNSNYSRHSISNSIDNIHSDNNGHSKGQALKQCLLGNLLRRE